MNIRVVQSGGFAGMVRAAELTTELLNADDRQRVESMVSRLPPAEQQAPIGADHFQYDLTITDGANTRAARYVGDTNPASDLIGEVFKQGTSVQP